MVPILRTDYGQLYEADCLDFLWQQPDECVDLAFADPPFNLGKKYASKIDDVRAEDDYLIWCKEWLDELIRTLKPGGSLFLWNLPKWNLPLGAHIGKKLTFRHWISVDIKYSLPISGRLYPAHYSLLYFVKGKRPTIFHPDRLPVPCCRQCGRELRDEGVAHRHVFPTLLAKKAEAFCNISFSSARRLFSRRKRVSSSASAF